jgi:competence protein ComFC
MNIFLQNRCLNCHEEIQPSIGWRAVFSEDKAHLICQICEGKLEKIEGDQCRICSRPIQHVDEKFRRGDLCHDCFRWQEDPEWHGYLEKNHSLYLYNEFLKEVIAKFKFRGDYVLAKIFSEHIKSKIFEIAPDLLVPIPLSEERQYERGFNQAAAILTEAGFAPAILLSRIHSEKQSKKSRSERIHLPQVFQINPDIQLAGRKVVLIDDIYTTGSTLRHAAKLLKEAGAASIQSLTLAR